MIKDGVAVKLLADSDVIQGGQGGVVVFGQRLLQPNNREVTVRVLVAYLQAVRDLNDNGWDNPEIVSIIQKYTEMEPALIARSAKPSYEANGALDEASILDIQAFQLSRGYVEYKEALPVAQMTDLTFLSEALARMEQK
jgi:ABC-type nitrate/sulfonate/bicarbonate transport system substrate-binding protein